jgi:DnaK suppressor protein
MDAIQEQAVAAAQDARSQARIRAIDGTLKRIEQGEFGRCDRCGEFIGQQRPALDRTTGSRHRLRTLKPA